MLVHLVKCEQYYTKKTKLRTILKWFYSLQEINLFNQNYADIAVLLAENRNSSFMAREAIYIKVMSQQGQFSN